MPHGSKSTGQGELSEIAVALLISDDHRRMVVLDEAPVQSALRPDLGNATSVVSLAEWLDVLPFAGD